MVYVPGEKDIRTSNVSICVAVVLSLLEIKDFLTFSWKSKWFLYAWL